MFETVQQDDLNISGKARIRIIVITSIFVLMAIKIYSCNEDIGGLYGGQCDFLDCHYDSIECQEYSDPYSIVIHYLKQPNQEREWTAKIVILLDNMENETNLHLEEQNFLNRVILSRPPLTGEQWPDYNGKSCNLDLSGESPNAKVSGKCTFSFMNGHFLTANFSCKLTPVSL